MKDGIRIKAVVPSVFNFAVIGSVLTPAATFYHPDLGIGVGIIAGLAALVTAGTSYEIGIRVPTEEEIRELFEDE